MYDPTACVSFIILLNHEIRMADCSPVKLILKLKHLRCCVLLKVMLSDFNHPPNRSRQMKAEHKASSSRKTADTFVVVLRVGALGPLVLFTTVRLSKDCCTIRLIILQQ